MDAYVQTEERDVVFKEFLRLKENNSCFDCGSKNPKWASVNLGLSICFDCSGRHRSYGTSISFVRSIDLDKWKRHQLEGMLLGGNLLAKQKFKELNIDYEDKYINYSNPKVSKYREELSNRVKISLNEKGITTMKAVNAVNTENNNKVVTSNSQQKPSEPIWEDEPEEKKEVVKESTVVDLGTGQQLKKNTNKKKAGKIEKCDFDFDWDDDNFSNNKKVTKNSKAVIQPEKEDNTSSIPTKSKFNNDDSDEEKGVVYGSQNQKNVGKEELESPGKVDNSKFNNRKAISSDDYANSQTESKWKQQEKESKLKQLKGASAISSAQLNGEAPEEETFGEKFKSMAYNFSYYATEKAKEIKDKSKNLINQVQEKYGN